LRDTEPQEIITLKQLKDSYDRLFKRAPIQESQEHYRWVLKVLAPEKGRRLVDIACGGGYFLREAETRDVKSFGFDLSTVALGIAKGKACRSPLICGAGEELPFRDNTFDYLTNLGSLEHFLDPKKGLREMARVLKKGGKALVLLPNSYFLMTIWNVLRTGSTGRKTEQEVDRWATKEEWMKLIEDSGLKVQRILKYNYKSSRAPFRYKLVRPFIPLNLSYHLLYVCLKA